MEWNDICSRWLYDVGGLASAELADCEQEGSATVKMGFHGALARVCPVSSSAQPA